VAPHRAVYEMTSEVVRGGSVTDISGRLVYEVLGSPCEGHTLSRRFVSEISGDEIATTSDQQLSTFEEGDGSTYRFISRSYFDERLTDETDGKATRRDDRVVVKLTAPRQEEIELPGNVLFPFQHMHRLIEAAQRGETIFTAPVFEGTDSGRTVYDTTAVIGERRPDSPPPNVPGAEALAELDSWLVSMAYFDPSDEAAEMPKYEFTYDLHANGVSTSMFLDYGDFALRAELSSIEFLDAASCE
jgi:hypothetical protein